MTVGKEPRAMFWRIELVFGIGPAQVFCAATAMAAAASFPPLAGLRDDERDMAIVSVLHAWTGLVDPLHVFIPGSEDARPFSTC